MFLSMLLIGRYNIKYANSITRRMHQLRFFLYIAIPLLSFNRFLDDGMTF